MSDVGSRTRRSVLCRQFLARSACVALRASVQTAKLIDEHREIVEQVRRDLLRGLRRPKTGRRGLTPQQVLRSLVLKRVKNWDYRELRERIADGMTLRQFTDFH